jgi:glycosyltransferase involved in cell wall biosynthesis
MQKTRRYSAWWAVMSYMSFPVVLARWLGTKVPYILTLQDGDPFEHVFERWRIRIFKSLLVRGFKEASVIQTISHFLADWARRLGYAGRVEVIPNGVDTHRFVRTTQRQAHQGTVLITTSRLVEKNGIGDVIDALTYLPESVRFQIIGTGPLEHALKVHVKRLHLESRVDFVGFVSPEMIPEYLHNADIFIRPSLSEGMGNSFIEAFAADVPVIATPVGGITDFLTDGVTGLFVPVRDPKAIAHAVTRLMEDSHLRSTVVANAHALALEKYDWDLIAEDMKKRVFEPPSIH